MLFKIMVVVCFLNYDVKSQICTKQQVLTRWVQEKYEYTYQATYMGKCIFGRRCKKTRIQNAETIRSVPLSQETWKDSPKPSYSYMYNDRRELHCDRCNRSFKNKLGLTSHIRAQESYNLKSPSSEPMRRASSDEVTKKEERSTFRKSMSNKQVVESVQVCCSGYRSLDIYMSSGDIACSAICSPACQNGHCSSPGVCECDLGFIADPARPHSCQPTCGDCGHGKCVAPNVCECNFGYSLQNGTCQAICTNPCDNGTCVAPDICECLPGYRKSVNNICTPYCTQGCWHGTCTAPETCVCDKGWHKVPTNECVPLCETECGNGTCTAPNICECAAGYKIDETKVPMCAPHCDIECGFGSCIAPNVCECTAGYMIDVTNVPMCVPRCDTECGNGTCIAPNVCECAAGYQIDGTNVAMCVPRCDIECGNGTCVAPNVCECAAGYQIDGTNVAMCVPRCDIECGNGTCVAPNVCECAAGYQIDGTKVPMCVPHCDIECGFGNCIAPNDCECTAGYEIDETKAPSCVPRCDIECGNGTCVTPSVCECAAGYLIDVNKEPMCVPVCENECGNGTCIAPNTCECTDGYKANETTVPICRPYCSLCGGICIAPGKCECEEPFKAKFVTADGQKCDDTTHKCARTVCTIETTERTTKENISYGYDDFLINDTIKVRNLTKNKSEDDNDGLEYNDYDSEEMYNITLDDTLDIDEITETERWTQSKWAYAVISVVAIIIAIILGSIAIYWKTLSRCCEGGNYAIEDKAKDEPNQESNPMRLSSLLKRKEADTN